MSESLLQWIALGVLALGALVVTYGWVGERIAIARRRARRCPRCGYDVSQVTSMTCSECGFTAKRERAFRRGRRRWRTMTFGALIVLVGLGGRRYHDVRDHGWYAGVPSTILLLVADPAEVVQRRTSGAAAANPAARRALAARQGNLTVAPAPVAPAHSASAADELRRRLHADELAGWQMRWCLRRALPTHADIWRAALRSRAEWPRDGAFAVALDLPYLPIDVPHHHLFLRARPTGSDEPWVGWWLDSRQRMNGDGSPLTWFTAREGRLGAVAFDLEIAVADRPGRDDDVTSDDATELWSAPAALVIERVDHTAADVLTPVDPELVPPEFPGYQFGPTVWIDDQTNEIALALIERSMTLRPATPHWSLGARVEVYCAEELVATGRVVHRVPTWSTPGAIGATAAVEYGSTLEWVTDPTRLADAPRDAWSLRLIGSAHVSLADLRATHYWDGTWRGGFRHVQWSRR